MPNAEGVGMWQNHNERAKNSLFTMYVVGHVKLFWVTCENKTEAR
jgi:hypothetical protein